MPSPITAMPATSRSSFITNALPIVFLSHEDRRPPGAAGVLDECVFQVQLDMFDAARRLRLQSCVLFRAEADEDELSPRAQHDVVKQPRASGRRGRFPAIVHHHLANRALEVL